MALRNAFEDLATEATLASVIAPRNNVPAEDAPALRVRAMPTPIDRISFAKKIDNNVDSSWATVVTSGAGMTINQIGGNLVLTSGTTVRSETIIRSVDTFTGDLRLRVRSLLSQRIVNQNFIAELVDVVGDGLTYSIGSATAITVTFPSGTLPDGAAVDGTLVGQSMTLCGFSGTGTFLSGRYPVASVSGLDVTFTVSGFAAGAGTVSVVGRDFYRLVYDGATATQMKFDTGRSGYGFGDSTVTINTTASPGHLALLTGKDLVATMADQLIASGTAIAQTVRGTRAENVPTDKALRLQIRVVNLATAPASTTTWTIGMVSVSELISQDVTVQDVRPMSNAVALPVEIMRNVSQVVTGTVTATPVAGTQYSLVTGTTTNTAFIKASAASLYAATFSNVTASTIYVKLYNKTTAPTLASDIPMMTFKVDAAQTVVQNFGQVGARFLTGLAIAITGAAAPNDTTATAAGAQIHITYL